MTEDPLRIVPDGGVLLQLPSGLQIIRRIKHEWTPMVDALKGEALERFTGRVRGSKFFRQWTLAAYVDWLARMVDALDWNGQSPASEHTEDLGQPVGFSKGKPVTKIRIELSSRCVHAYPVED